MFSHACDTKRSTLLFTVLESIFTKALFSWTIIRISKASLRLRKSREDYRPLESLGDKKENFKQPRGYGLVSGSYSAANYANRLKWSKLFILMQGRAKRCKRNAIIG